MSIDTRRLLHFIPVSENTQLQIQLDRLFWQTAESNISHNSKLQSCICKSVTCEIWKNLGKWSFFQNVFTRWYAVSSAALIQDVDIHTVRINEWFFMLQLHIFNQFMWSTSQTSPCDSCYKDNKILNRNPKL